MSEGKGKVEVGKKYYIMIHAYHHILCEIVQMLGPQRAEVKNVRWVASCRRGWEDFFKDGCEKDTVLYKFPDGEVSWTIGAFIWEHEIP